MSRQKKREQAPVWDLDFLQDWTVPVWELDSFGEWAASLDELQSTWDQITAEIERPFLTWAAEAEVAFADADGTPDEAASFTRDEAERK